VALRLGILGCGSVLWGPYLTQIERLVREGRLEVTAVHDPDPAKQQAVAERVGVASTARSDADVIDAPTVDLVGIFTSMNPHGSLALRALDAGKHVLVEKPMATSLDEAAALLERSKTASGTLLCAPHIILSPTFVALRRLLDDGVIGTPVSARARYGWAGPDWGTWFYRPGGGSLFDLGVYNLTSLCGLFGPVRRVTAMTGVAIPTRVVEGETIEVQAEDNAHVLLDFGQGRLAVVTTGFTIQKYRSPAIEVYGTKGTAQLMGDDWAPEGLEVWRNDRGVWEIHPETDPSWPWTYGLRHLVDCIEAGTETVTRPEHAYHALEVMLAAQAAGRDGRAREVTSPFPLPDWDAVAPRADDHRRTHDPRSTLG
jgi:predicted dehydrogenase